MVSILFYLGVLLASADAVVLTLLVAKFTPKTENGKKHLTCRHRAGTSQTPLSS